MRQPNVIMPIASKYLTIMTVMCYCSRVVGNDSCEVQITILYSYRNGNHSDLSDVVTKMVQEAGNGVNNANR